jgi:beta-glucosidase
VAAAKQAKVVVLVLGTLGWDSMNQGDNPNPNSFEREGHDRTSIALTPNQYVLAEAVARSGTPVVCVLIHGGSIQLGSLLKSCTAVVDAWFPGQQGGAGFADVLFGKVNPAGRSPQTFYSSDAELPPLGNMDLYAGNGTTYRYYRNTPVVPFGAGLSYTTFTYSNLRVDRSTVGPCDSVALTVDIKNTGKVDGDEVVQVYVKTPGASVPAPRVRLSDFERVHIPAGETAIVTLTITPKYHYVVFDSGKDNYWTPTMKVEAGPFEIYIGGGQPDYTAGVLNSTVHVSSTATISTQFKC